MSTRARPWRRWTTLVVGVALFIPFADFFALPVTLLWIVITSTALARTKTEPTFVELPGTT